MVRRPCLGAYCVALASPQRLMQTFGALAKGGVRFAGLDDNSVTTRAL